MTTIVQSTVDVYSTTIACCQVGPMIFVNLTLQFKRISSLLGSLSINDEPYLSFVPKFVTISPIIREDLLYVDVLGCKR